MKTLITIGLVALMVTLISGCTFPGSFWQYSEPACRVSCNYDNNPHDGTLKCTVPESCLYNRGGEWIADTNIYYEASVMCPPGRSGDYTCWCNDEWSFTYVPAKTGMMCCKWNPNPEMTCFLEDEATGEALVGEVIAGDGPSDCGRFIGCKFSQGAPVGANILTIDLTGQIQPPPETPPREYCGDDICQQTEDCNSCAIDCGNCPDEPPEPVPPARILDIFVSVFQSLWDWFFGLFHLGQVVTSDEIALVGDTFQNTFTLTNNAGSVLPDDYYLDGDRSWLYYGYGIFDSRGILVEVDLTEISQKTDPGETITLPVSYTVKEDDATGRYAVIASLISVTSTYDKAASQWVEAEPVVIDKKAASFNVETLMPPSEPGFDIGQWLQDLFAGIRDWFCNTAGLMC